MTRNRGLRLLYMMWELLLTLIETNKSVCNNLIKCPHQCKPHNSPCPYRSKGRTQPKKHQIFTQKSNYLRNSQSHSPHNANRLRQHSATDRFIWVLVSMFLCACSRMPITLNIPCGSHLKCIRMMKLYILLDFIFMATHLMCWLFSVEYFVLISNNN